MAVLAALAVMVVARRPDALRRERQAALDELAETENRYRAMFQVAGAGIVIADDAERVLVANPSFLEIAGFDEGEEITGAPFPPTLRAVAHCAAA